MDNKPKRQRRSYACGPCKLLKIKCDLQTPCSGCLKFKRADKCKEDPPQPPSAEELSKTLERKKKSLTRKQLLPPEVFSTVDPGDAQVHSGHPRGIATVMPSSGAPQPNPVPIIGSQLPRIHHPPPTQVSHYGFQLLYPYQYGQKFPYGIQQSVASLGQPHAPAHAPGYPPLTIHHVTQRQHNQQHQLPPQALSQQDQLHPQPQHIQQALPQPQSQHQPSAHSKPLYYQSPLIRYDYHDAQQPPAPSSEPAAAPSHVLAESVTIHQPVQQDQASLKRSTLFDDTLVMAAVDLSELIDLFPSTFEEGKSLIDVAISSHNPLFRYDKDVLWGEYVRFANEYKDPKAPGRDLATGASFEIHTARNLSILLIYFAIGSLFLDNALVLGRIDFAKHIRTILSRYDTVRDIQYLIDFHFALRGYLLHSELVLDHFLEFNNLLSCISLNDEFMELITEKPVYSSNTLALRSWTKIRAVQIEFPFFEARGSLLSVWQFKDLILPHKEVINFAFYDGNDLTTMLEDDTASGPRFGPELSHGVTKFFIDIWAIYYKRAEQSPLVKDIVRSYLELYGEVYNLTSKETSKYEKMKKTGEISRSILTLRQSLLSLAKNQVTLSLFTRWLSFVRIESTYFPLLRYASYITSIISSLNHFRFLVELCPHDDIIKLIADEFGFYIFHYFQIGIIFQAIFNVTVSNFLNLPNSNNVLRLQEIYDKLSNDLQFATEKFKSSSIYTDYLSKVPACSVPFQIVDTLVALGPELINSRCEKFHDFIEIIYSKLDNKLKKFIEQRQFGSNEAFKRYLEKVWDLFTYLTAEEQRNKQIIIHDGFYLDMDLINECKDKFNGIVFTKDLVNNYMRDVSEPNLWLQN